jgi:hypothetical protein
LDYMYADIYVSRKCTANVVGPMEEALLLSRVT